MNYQAVYENTIYRESKRLVLFCNQTAYDHSAKLYLFDTLAAENKLGRLLIPEHGLFSEFQDQEPITNMTYKGVPCTSLYDKANEITGPAPWMFEGSDALLIDIQDAGVRFFTYTTHMFALLEFVSAHVPDMPILVIDRPNLAEKKVEGTPLQVAYKSFLGYPGMIHRHGLSTGELCRWLMKTKDLKAKLHLIPVSAATSNFTYISPSPNLPVLESLQVYPGQCFWEATTFSEGRGTTRPFTLFGHPNLPKSLAEEIAKQYNARFVGQSYLRKTSFIPVFHKHKDRVCVGWQLHLERPDEYHSVLSSLWIMQQVKQRWQGHFWREGAYEFDSPSSAAQLLLGDDDLIRYVDGKLDEPTLLSLLAYAEDQWIKNTADCRHPK
jgi:uncharacterized protein YbbC (DUF1343 family)